MPVIQGTVQAVYKNEVGTKFGMKETCKFKINDSFYSGGFKKWDIREGDRVEVTFETNAKGYNDIKRMDRILPDGTSTDGTISVAPRPEVERYTEKAVVGNKQWTADTFPMDAFAPKRSINRQNALTNAVAYANEREDHMSVEDIIQVARQFEAYTTGDMDVEEAKKLAGVDK